MNRYVLWGALFVSVALNVRSFWPQPSVAAGSTSAVRIAHHQTPHPATTGRGGLPAAPLESCAKDLAAAKLALGQTQSALEQRIDAQTRFDIASREQALEARMTPLIQAALTKMKGVSGQLECRGDMCQVRISASSRAEAQRAWEVFTKDEAIGALSDSFSMDAGEPVVDLATGRGAFESNFYVTTRALNDLSPQLEELIAAFRESDDFRQCGNGLSGAVGVLEAKLTLVADEKRITMAFGGSLAGTVPGGCISAKLEQAVAHFNVPAGVTFGQAYATFAPHVTL